jgi:transcriptional regulator with XRE-family HTH domain
MSRDSHTVITDLAFNLRQCREKAKLSQEALALAADVDRTYVSQIERGIGNPSITVVCKLANELGLDIQLLLAPYTQT